MSGTRSLRDRSLRPVRRWARRRRAMHLPTFSASLHERLIAEPGDYTRLATMALALQRVANENVRGSLAEVGVYRGEASIVLHAALPSRTLHLFDTFAGFPQRDLEVQDGDQRFRDTSPELVRSRFPPGADVLLHDGYVPATFASVADEAFAFVLLDLDLRKPTRASLDFFYPRMSPGAYVFVHDYNSSESGGACRQAVDSFMADKPEPLIELCDIAGSVVFRRLRDSSSSD